MEVSLTEMGKLQGSKLEERMKKACKSLVDCPSYHCEESKGIKHIYEKSISQIQIFKINDR